MGTGSHTHTNALDRKHDLHLNNELGLIGAAAKKKKSGLFGSLPKI